MENRIASLEGGVGALLVSSGAAEVAANHPDMRDKVSAMAAHASPAALLAHRLGAASGAGCDIAVVTTAPGSVSQKGTQRWGLHLLFTRAILVHDTGGY